MTSQKIFLLALVVALLQHHDTSAAPVISSPTVCTNIPPGFGQLQRGVDVTKLDLLPATARQDLGYRNAVLDFTCNKGTTFVYTSPNGTQITYQIPDQMSSALFVQRQYLNYVGSNYNMYHQYRDQLINDAKIDPDFALGAFTSSVSYRTIQTAQQQTLMEASYAQTFPPGIVGQMQPYWGLNFSDVAQRFIDTVLPDDYETNPEAYNELITNYGTHYIGSGELGGIFSNRLSYASTFRKNFGDDRITANVESSLIALLKTHGAEVNDSTHVVDPSFQAATTAQLVFYGGVGGLLDSNKFHDWWESVPLTPWLTSVELVPLWRLVTGANSTQKQASVKRATLNYVDQAYLADLQRSLGTFVRRTARGQDQGQVLLSNITTMLQKLATNASATLDHAAVVQLGQTIKTFLQPLTTADEIVSQTTLQINTNWDGKWPVARGAGDSVADACGETSMQFGVTFPNTATAQAILDTVFIQHTYSVATSPQPTVNTTKAQNGQITEPINHCRLPLYDVQGNRMQQSVTWSLQMPKSAPGYLRNIEFCVSARFNSPPFNSTQPVQTCAYANEETVPVVIEFVWLDRTPAMTWTWSLNFGDLGPY